jgi:putative phosphonate metabolism protein
LNAGSEFPRYAVYFVPAAETALYRFGAATLGYDCYTGVDLPAPDAPPLDAGAWRALTHEPRRYGFHATLKAPFRLAAEHGEAELIAEIERFARTIGAVPAIVPEVELLGNFIAIVPGSANAEVGELAASCVTRLDRFRAPMGEGERKRRLAARLTAQQIAYLEQWGYAYVFDQFRFHMTLTGAIAADRAEPVLSWLRDCFGKAHGKRPIPIDRLALLRQDRPDARFAVIAAAPIGTR